MRLFLQSGYGKVTVGDIAHEANVAVPMQRHRHPGWDHTAHHTEIFGPSQELNGRPQHIQCLAGWFLGDTVEDGAVVKLHVMPLS